MKKERIFYLDFIRAIAVVAILLTHFNAFFVFANPTNLRNVVITYRVANLYIGDFGVTLFFIISGAALMYVYDDKLEIKNFFKKRVLSIYPMFYLTFVIAFLYTFYINKGFSHEISKVRFLFTLSGFDGYFAGITPTFYLVGEWFLGCIILVYVLFPLLRVGVKKYPKITIAIALILYILSVGFYNGSLHRALLVTTRLPEILFGMFFIKYIKKVPLPAFIGAIIVIVANTVVQPTWNSSIQTTYIGITSFLVLVFIADYLKWDILHKICSIISKYSYAIFLTHHFIINRMTEGFDRVNMTRTDSYLLFISCCFVTGIASKVVFELDKKIQSGVVGYLNRRKKPIQRYR